MYQYWKKLWENSIYGKKGYIFIVISTFIHGVIAYLFLGSMPSIGIGQKLDVFVITIGLWWCYASSIYVFIKKKTVEKTQFKMYREAIIYGGIFTFIKMILDILLGLVGDYIHLMIVLVYVEGLYTLLVGLALIFYTFMYCGKKKIKLEIRNIIKPMCLLLILLAFHFLFMKYYLNGWNEMLPALDEFNREPEKLDYYYAFRVLDLNVKIYMLCYPIFWWLLTKSIVGEGEKAEEI